MHHFPSMARAALTVLVLSIGLAQPGFAQPLTLTPFKPGGIYETGERVGWTVTPPQSLTGAAAQYTYTIKKNNSGVIQGGTLNLSKPGVIAVSLDEPAMLYVEVKSSAPGAVPQVVGAAVAPDRLRSTEPEPADFDRFWAAKIRQLDEVPMAAVLTPKPSDRETVEYFTFRLDHIDGRHIHGQLARPKRTGRFPGLLLYQGAGGPYPLQKHWGVDRAAGGWPGVNNQPHDVRHDAPHEQYAKLPK